MRQPKPTDARPVERAKPQPPPVIELTDCGCVSADTRGLSNLIFFEIGTPPNDRYFEDW